MRSNNIEGLGEAFVLKNHFEDGNVDVFAHQMVVVQHGPRRKTLLVTKYKCRAKTSTTKVSVWKEI